MVSIRFKTSDGTSFLSYKNAVKYEVERRGKVCREISRYKHKDLPAAQAQYLRVRKDFFTEVKRLHGHRRGFKLVSALEDNLIVAKQHLQHLIAMYKAYRAELRQLEKDYGKPEDVFKDNPLLNTFF